MIGQDNQVELLANTLSSLRRLGVRTHLLVSQILHDTLAANSDLLAVWSVWEPYVLDPHNRIIRQDECNDRNGRFAPYWHRAGGGAIRLEPLHGYDQPGSENGYEFVRRHGQTCQITEPMMYKIAGRTHWITSEIAPIIERGTVIGAVGIDWTAVPTQRENALAPVAKIMRHSDASDQMQLLTAREREVHYWVCNGKSNDEIAVILGISANTVKNHLSAIYQKLGVENRYAAALLGRQPFASTSDMARL
jgi:DNA-binding CsgD family transcriptional regulator